MKTKKEIRAEMVKRRRMLDVDQVDQFSTQIASSFFDNISMKGIRVVHVFMPITSKVEVNTWGIINLIKRSYPDVKIVIPKTDFKDYVMESYELDQSRLKINSWGIPEPVDGIKVLDKEIDLVIVPLLAFDKSGFRVGYGKGIYDKFFAGMSQPVLKVGVSFFNEVEEISDVNEYDVALDHCITPNKIWDFGKQ